MRLIYFALLVVALAAVAAILFIPGWLDRLSGLSPTDPSEPGDDDREASDPVEHEGASEEWGAKLRALREGADHTGQELLANLRASALEEVAAHEQMARTIDALCDDLMAELDALCDKYAAASKAFGRRHTKELGLDAHGRAWLAAGLPGDTGEIDRRQLDAMLAGA